jgi:hypothetical protein
MNGLRRFRDVASLLAACRMRRPTGRFAAALLDNSAR